MDIILKNEDAVAYAARIPEDRVRRAVEFGIGLAVRVALENKDSFIRDANAVPLDLLLLCQAAAGALRARDHA
jgi:hypothetical protein